jgi:hypothetical protein
MNAITFFKIPDYMEMVCDYLKFNEIINLIIVIETSNNLNTYIDYIYKKTIIIINEKDYISFIKYQKIFKYKSLSIHSSKFNSLLEVNFKNYLTYLNLTYFNILNNYVKK